MMDWYYLGHAMWLADIGGLRVLFDPLLEPTHHGGVFEVVPRRTVDARALRADFLVVSHAHPDHFDVPSLRRLARLDPDTVVITSDPLVAHAARAVGFRSVQTANAFDCVEVQGAQLLTTPSFGSAVEWGVLVATADGTVWNQVDCWFRDPSDVRETLAAAARGIPRNGDLADGGLTLALARWQPLREIAAQLGEATGFPMRDYAATLEQVAALRARVVVPASAGGSHTAPFDWMNCFTHPVPEARFLRDVRARCPGTVALPAVIGGRYRVTREGCELDREGGRGLVTLDAQSPLVPAQRFRPFAVPELEDPNVRGRDEGAMHQQIDRWVHDELAPALARAHGGMGVGAEVVRFVLEVVCPLATVAYTLAVDARGARVTRAYDEDYDVLDQVAGSMLCDVLDGRICWGDVLLAGALRASTRAYRVDPEAGVRAARVGATFVYYALSYDESVRRSVEWALGQE